MIKIGVDLRCLPTDGSPGSGVAHAARDLWCAFVERASRSTYPARPTSEARPQSGRHVASGEAGPGSAGRSKQKELSFIGFAGRGTFVPRGVSSMVWLPDVSGKTLRRALKAHPVDVLFIASGAVPYGILIPVFPWVHDVAIFEHPAWFPQSWLKRQITTRLYTHGLRQAQHIFAVSENTKQELHRLLGIDLARVTSTSQGIQRQEGDEHKNLLHSSNALIMGTVEPRKNIPFIISLWPEVMRRVGRPVSLIIAGGKGWGNVTIPKESFITRHAKVSDEKYYELLQTTAMSLTPSLYEGFGRSALEAMAVSTPVIVSDRGALPEVVADGGVVLSLNDGESWIREIVRLFTDQSYAEMMGERGRQRAQIFSWDAVVQRILAILVKD